MSLEPAHSLHGAALLRPRVGYVVKRYPRYSETFIVNEILAHEAAGLDLEIFSLYPPNDTHFQDSISRVRASVTYLPFDNFKAADLWRLMQEQVIGGAIPWESLSVGHGEDVRELYAAMLLSRLVRQRGITHLHAHFATSATSVARMAGRFAGVPYSFTAHAKDIFHQSVTFEDLARKLTGAAAVVTVSEFNLAHLRHTFAVAEPDAVRRIVRIYNGMDLERLHYNAPAHRRPLIVSAGRLVEKKGFADLIDACAILAGRGVEFRCEIIGTGELEGALRTQIAGRGLQDRVHLLGPRPQREVFDLIARAAVFAAPCVVGGDSNRDGLPTVLLEAMALGTPCVSTDVTGIPEVVRHQQTGLMVPQHAPDALADACQRLLGDAALRVPLARSARQLIEDEFDITRTSARLREIFAGCAPPGRADVTEAKGQVEPQPVEAA